MLKNGQTISHYTILERIGSGGMGEVYKARDTRLNRLVAIKTLPAERVIDQERNRRFVQEAKAASALNHPNIITIYEIDSTGRVPFIAMEYINGRTMKEVVPGNGLGPGQALKYAVQIADALAALHRQGIVHRDLKPTNVMVGEDAGIKLLDFGLAKLTAEFDVTDDSRQTTMDQTEAGVVLGTLPYMSPEQVEGKPVDIRSDIFSFGVVMYEMITGRRPFPGIDRSSIAAAILHEEPVPLAHIKSSVPPEIERTVSRCLEKDPQRRFQHAADLKISLEWLARDVDSGKLRPMKAPGHLPGRKRTVLLALALMLAVLVIAAAARYLFRSAPQLTADLREITSDRGLSICPALSPDGNLLAYSSDRSGEGNLDIWVQQTMGGQAIRRTFGPTDALSPNFSPDGGSIVFKKTGSGIFIMPTLTGDERQIAPSGLDPRFSPDGTRIVYWVGDVDNPAPSATVYTITPSGGAPVQIGADFADARCPIWAPDGRSILIQGIRSPGEDPEWWVVPIAPGPAMNTGILTQLRKQKISPVPGPGDWKGKYLAFSAREEGSRHIWVATIEPPEFRLDGAVRQFTHGTGTEADLSIAASGRVAVAGWYYHNNLWRLSLQPGESGSGRLDLLSKTGTFDTHPSISADGKRMAFLSRRSGTRQIWIRDFETGKETGLTVGSEDKSAPVISPDGSRVAFSKVENGKPSIYVVSVDSSKQGAAGKVCDNCGPPSDWIPDMSGILYTSEVPQCVYRLDLKSGKSTPILQNPKFSLDQPHVSPDGRWIAFVAAVSPDRAKIYVSPLTAVPSAPDQWIAVTDGNSWDDKPRWLADDSLIYYSNRDNFGCLWKQQLKPGIRQLAGIPVAVHHFHELKRSPRILYRSDFEIAVTKEFIALNMGEMSGNIYLTSLPLDR